MRLCLGRLQQQRVGDVVGDRPVLDAGGYYEQVTGAEFLIVPTLHLDAERPLPAEEQFALVVVVPRELANQAHDPDDGVIDLRQVARLPRGRKLARHRIDRDPALRPRHVAGATDAQAIAVGIAHLDVAPPRVVLDLDTELVRDRVDVLDGEVHQRARPRAPSWVNTYAGVSGSKRCSPTLRNPRRSYHSTARSMSAIRMIGATSSFTAPPPRVASPNPVCASLRAPCPRRDVGGLRRQPVEVARPARSPPIGRRFAHRDLSVDSFVAKARTDDLILFISGHGFQSRTRALHMDHLLKEFGYLEFSVSNVVFGPMQWGTGAQRRAQGV